MSRHNRRTGFKVLCPNGGEYYACGSGSNFVGCCVLDPCSNGCGAGSLKPMSFEKDVYSEAFPDQECSSSSLWYTCAYTNSPFVGCCKSNTCVLGQCPVGDLTAGFLSGNGKLAAPYLDTSSFLPSKIVTSESLPSEAAAAASTSPTSQPAYSADSKATGKTSMGAIAGSAAGMVAIAILLLAVIWFRSRRGKSAELMELTVH